MFNKIEKDTTGDGKTDTVITKVVDAEIPNGRVAMISKDTTGDGQMDTYFKDTTGDGTVDSVAKDTRGDGVVDTFIKVSPEDGTAETVKQVDAPEFYGSTTIEPTVTKYDIITRGEALTKASKGSIPEEF